MAAVKRYDILDTPSDGSFDRITAIAARLFNVPISIISIVDHDRIWFKSHHGLDVAQIGRDPGLCASAILSADPYILKDARKDVRSLANPLVAGDFGLRFYAGVPLETTDGYNLGTLCVIDKEPRPMSQAEIDNLKDLASMVTDQLEYRLSGRIALNKAHLLKREIEHRVMNSLQAVSGMLRLQGKKAADIEVAKQLDTAAGRVAAVARVHRHFHLEADAERAAALPYLQRLCEDLSGVLGSSVKVEGDAGLLHTSAIQPVGLIVNELVTNAAKHGTGEITVSFVCGEICKLSVCDEGNGLPPGFDPATSAHGLGMTIVALMTNQLNGKFTAGDKLSGDGACFRVEFRPI